jgi:hypothetical protein
MGLAPATLYLPSLFGSDRAAYAAAPPKRVYIFHTQHGPPHWDYSLKAGSPVDKGGYKETALGGLTKDQLSPVLQPLYDVRNDVIALDGVSNTAAFVNNSTNCHNLGNATVLTGAATRLGAGFNNEGTGGDVSVDQVIAKQVAVAGRKPYLYTATWGSWSPVFAGSNQEIKGINEPKPLYDAIVGLAPSSGGTAPAAPDKLAQARASVVDLVRPDYDNLSKKLSGDDQKKLQQHMALMNDLQKRLQAIGGGGMAGGGSASCNLGSAPGGVAMHAENAEGCIKVLVPALACDITRVVVQVHNQMSPEEFGGPAGKDVHQDIAHQAGAQGSDPAKWMTLYYQRHAKQFAMIVAAMKAIPEGNGTMLDNTAVLWTTEIGDGPHNLYNQMYVLAGSCGGAFKTGRYLQYDQTFGNPGGSDLWGGNHRTGPAHNKILVSLMKAMGLTNNSIGLASVKANAATGGAMIDMSGELPGLRG